MIRIQRLVVMGTTGLLLAMSFAPVRSGELSANDFRSFIVDPARHEISLHWKSPQGQLYRRLEALKSELSGRGKAVLAVMNAGIYDKKYRPLGLHIEGGKMLRPLQRRKGGGNFYMQPNGVFYIDAKGAAIKRTSQFKLSGDMVLATQSGPLLFDEDGLHPAFVKNSRHRYFRNAVGVRKDGHVVFVISKKPVTFWQLAHFLRDQQSCISGLYLDGFISQLWRQGEGRARQGYGFVGMLAVTERVR
ncbi:MAG: phosphodiester glycosidase family protein [Hyphomicrobiaceae bacterium]|nr:phosphodiester glycosidase family protein [Hyphomicrobiaceae bacterium]